MPIKPIERIWKTKFIITYDQHSITYNQAFIAYKVYCMTGSANTSQQWSNWPVPSKIRPPPS